MLRTRYTAVPVHPVESVTEFLGLLESTYVNQRDVEVEKEDNRFREAELERPNEGFECHVLVHKIR
jgi:hypothetical protein